MGIVNYLGVVGVGDLVVGVEGMVIVLVVGVGVVGVEVIGVVKDLGGVWVEEVIDVEEVICDERGGVVGDVGGLWEKVVLLFILWKGCWKVFFKNDWCVFLFEIMEYGFVGLEFFFIVEFFFLFIDFVYVWRDFRFKFFGW